jgi:23S rRNA pseudouridine2605 synthase
MAPKAPPTSRDSAPGERLQKLLSSAGIASRRHAEELITAGRVAVNGVVARELGTRADPAHDVVTVDGERLMTGGPRRTLVLHKPRGVVSTMADPEGRPTVRDLVRGVGERLYPVGRLDLQTSGVLLVTNDGTLAARLLSGEQGIERVYQVKVDGRPTPRTIERLRRGVRLGAGTPVVAGVRVLREMPTKTWLEMRIRRGQWHVVRRVDKLERVAFGPIELGSLKPGAIRELTRGEMQALREAAGLSASRSPAAGTPVPVRPRPAPRRGKRRHKPGSGSPARARTARPR